MEHTYIYIIICKDYHLQIAILMSDAQEVFSFRMLKLGIVTPSLLIGRIHVFRLSPLDCMVPNKMFVHCTPMFGVQPTNLKLICRYMICSPHIRVSDSYMDMGQNPVPLVNTKIASKWMFISLY